MDQSKISVRYAKALFVLAMERDMLEKVQDDIIFLQASYSASDVFRDLVDNPVLSASAKSKVIKKAFSPSLSALSIDFLELLIRNNRLAFLPAVGRRFVDEFRKQKGIMAARLTTASEIGKGSLEKVESMLVEGTGNTVEMDSRVDSELLGGFILQVDDRQIDASIRSQLKEIKRQLSN